MAESKGGEDAFFLGCDVGTGSVRTSLFSRHGKCIVSKSFEILTNNPRPEFYEQSSTNIWTAVCDTIFECVQESNVSFEKIQGIGFDATCSLVFVGDNFEPIPVGDSDFDIILWMDHRAVEQTNRINVHGTFFNNVLKYVGGKLSPEMQLPKILWMLENHPERVEKATHILDLVDFLTYRATGKSIRSSCTTTCKWTYVKSQGGWHQDFLKSVGLEKIVSKIGTEIRPPGFNLGPGTFGNVTIPAVGVGLIDAHAGGVGVLSSNAISTGLAIISGTSACHMACTENATFVPGVWGPYEDAMIPQFWLNEGGQTAAGRALDVLIRNHPAYANLPGSSHNKKIASLNKRLLSEDSDYRLLGKDVHVYPDLHGNRSPLADPDMRGMITGLSLAYGKEESLLEIYVATLQALALSSKMIVDEMNRHRLKPITNIYICGGLTNNELYIQCHADVFQSDVHVREGNAMTLGSAMLGACASGHFDSLLQCMDSMHENEAMKYSPNPDWADFYKRKFQVYVAMSEHQKQYRQLMSRDD